MMKNTILCAATAACLTAPVQASDVNLSIESGGSNTVDALIGTQVSYEIWAELSDANNSGLALLCFDLEFDGGNLDQAGDASSPTQLNFASPLGLSNPAGYGGTPDGGRLLQVGGAQNTIKNSFAPMPTGAVISDVAASGSPFLFASGVLIVPATAGVYHLDASNLIANVIRLGETGTGEFWAVDEAGAGTLTGLTIDVSDCDPVTYCTAKVNSQGCTPGIGTSGSPSLTGADDLHITASNIVNNKTGVMFWGPAAHSVAFLGGTLCVSSPHQRTPAQLSGGSVSGDDCTGSYDFHFSQAYMVAHGFSVGTQVNLQYWSRDPMHADGTGVGLTDAVEFTICP